MVANISATLPACSYCNTTVGAFLSYEPRCVKRDISSALGQVWANDSMIADLLSNPLYQTDIGAFQDRLQYTGTDTVGWYGLHAYGHFAVNGDPSGDGYNSPNEPLFWLHHGQVDRLWWIWQNQRPLERAFQINGTRTLGNSPPSADATIEDLINVGFVDGEYDEGLAIKNYVSTMGGPLCYIYE
ncbi:hypothetical protein Daus18300_001716 [Diaporthe australafricana]|uniref:Tyrosinase copper-binding domain-containing protein n=1 Tax=Diaporthe australafricana TaxID=127596 RepID=A0ABR3XW82_9PEZI